MNFFIELKRRNALLFWFGLFNLAVAIVCLVLMPFEETQILGVNRWLKPFKFYSSVGIMVLTMGWLLYYLSNDKKIRTYSRLIFISMLFENGLIITQAIRNTTSHFNVTSTINGIIFNLMGVFILVFTITVLLICISFFKQKQFSIPAAYVWGIRLGILFFLFFSLEGGAMLGLLKHTVGGPDGGPGLPLINWSTQYGDLRIAHFIGIHSLQVLPLFGNYFAKNKKTNINIFRRIFSSCFGIIFTGNEWNTFAFLISLYAKILFIGASGMLGKPVALELLRAGFPVTFLARDVEKMQKLFPNASVLKGDVFDIVSLEAAMAGQEIVYLNLSVAQSSKKSDPQPEREGINNIIEAAKKTNIKRIVYLSSLIKNYEGMNGFNWWAFQIKHAAVNAIKKSGLNYSIFYPSTFMECLDKQMLQGTRIMLAGKSVAPMWFIAAKDYGVQVAWAMKKAGDTNQEYVVQGLEPFTSDEAAKVFIENVKSKIKILKAPIAPLKYIGIFNQRMNYAYHICEALNKYPEKFESENTWNDLGKPSTTLAEYIASLKI